MFPHARFTKMYRSVAFITAIILLIAGFVFTAGQVQPAIAQQPTATPVSPEATGTNNNDRLRTISVSGTGMAEAAPDQALVSLGVQTDAETAGEALTQNNQQMASLISALRSAGIAEADIQTLSVQLYPRYETPPQPVEGSNQNEISGFTAINTVQVRVRNLDNLGQILDDAVQSGGNQIHGVSFDISDKTEVLDQAREAALQDARHKAEQLAGLVDAELGPIVTINESSRFPVMYEAAGGAAFDQAAAQVPISPGSQSVSVDLQVTWEVVLNTP